MKEVPACVVMLFPGKTELQKKLTHCESINTALFPTGLIVSLPFSLYRAEVALAGLEGRWKELGGELHSWPSIL